MRSVLRNPRAARAAIALLAGLLVGGWVGGGLVWILNRNKFKDPNTVADVALTKADELELVPADAMGFVHLRAAEMWKSEAMAEFRKVLDKSGQDVFKVFEEGFVPTPSSLDRATIVVIKAPAAAQSMAGPNIIVPKKGGGFGAPPPPPPPPLPKTGAPPPAFNPIVPVELSPAVIGILAFSMPFDEVKVREANMPNASDELSGGKKYWKDDASGISVHFASNRVMVVGSANALHAYLSKEPAKVGALASAIKLASSGSRHLVAAVNVSQVPATLPIELPEEVRSLLRAESLTLGAILGNGAKVDLRASYPDEASAKNAEKTLRTAAESGRKKLAKMKADMEEAVRGKADAKKPRPIAELPQAVGGLFGLGAVNMLDEWLADPPLNREGNEISATVTVNSLGGGAMSMSAMSVGMLLPAVSKVREAAARSTDMNNLKQIGVAFHVHASANEDKLPNAAWSTKLDPAGRPLPHLSWRVAILPFIEEDNLYRQFKLDEPWDSENNKKLIPLMPKIYTSPLAPTEPGKTYYKVFTGPGTIYERNKLAKYMIGNIPDGTSNTILVAEGGDPVTWTKPDDFVFDPAKPLPNIWLPGKPGINVCMADGSVRFINRSISEATLKNAIQADEGNILGPDW